MDDKITGYLILLASIVGIGVYFWLVFLTSWAWLTIQVSAMAAVGGVLLISAWIGYTLATTPPPVPLKDLDLDDFDFDEDEEIELEEAPEEETDETG